ncbi:hypothetical protein BGZ70_000301 [Mortierella alpina]|uniref:Palmitoyl-protein thioesterase 1 n=1 Tax=Mortierella alpina TaxID=64518 RepID=A0A9P6LZ75_MORAP|nr:hypothetical protein BGZ70_000301 [Mortierella alpina]
MRIPISPSPVLCLSLAALVACAGSATAAALSLPVALRPIVFYHGMGDSAHSKGMVQLFESIRDIAPGIFIHSISLAESESDDQRAGFFGNVNNQIELVCEQLKGIEELKDGFNAVGFSQGGQFLRAYIQRCNGPPVHNLVTVGSQHGGVSDIPGCVQAEDASCRLMRTIARSGVYSGYVRDHIVQAQYYKDPKNIERYLERSIFLPDINNELAIKNSTYAKRLTSINKLVMFMFKDDLTVKPKETAWFGFEDENGEIIDLEDQDQYKQDWLGLKTMDHAGKLVFDILEGEHMQFSLEDFTGKITKPYLLEVEDGNASLEDENDHRDQRKMGHRHRKGSSRHHDRGGRHGRNKNRLAIPRILGSDAHDQIVL